MIEIGQGGAGRVFRINETTVEKTVKLTKTPTIETKEFIKNNIINIFNNSIYNVKSIRFFEKNAIISWDYISGITLESYINQGFKLNTYQIDSIYKALEHLTSINVNHGDISASNILITDKKEIKLIDFRLLDSNNEDITSYTNIDVNTITRANITRRNVTRRNITRGVKAESFITRRNITRGQVTRANFSFININDLNSFENLKIKLAI
ncbi:protein kinase [Olleya sp. YS]|uniref:protein kinase domain-containing protein n=1 Tax=Olleya sp. YS TaxID=3028318 RepID=UPI0024342F75|nr:protein kinase [Olleya sp. YS]WGD34704.1 protein kinase [Olleya sp. YS]